MYLADTIFGKGLWSWSKVGRSFWKVLGRTVFGKDLWSKIDIWQRRPCKRRFPNDRTKVARLSSVRRSRHRSATGSGGECSQTLPKPSLKVRPCIQPKRCGTRPVSEHVCRRAARLSEPNAERADQRRQVSSYSCPGKRLCRRLIRRRVTLDERENRVNFNTSFQLLQGYCSTA